MRMRVVQAERLVVSRVYVTCSPRGEEHLYRDHGKDGHHGDEAWHGRIALVPKVRQTWIGERFEGRGEQVDKGGRDQNAGTEVSREEEELVGDRNRRKAPDDNRKGASCHALARHLLSHFTSTPPRPRINPPAVLRKRMRNSAKT